MIIANVTCKHLSNLQYCCNASITTNSVMFVFQACLKLLASVSFLYAIVRFIKWCINRRIVNNIPGPHPHFITGNLNDFIGTSGSCTFYSDIKIIKRH